MHVYILVHMLMHIEFTKGKWTFSNVLHYIIFIMSFSSQQNLFYFFPLYLPEPHKLFPLNLPHYQQHQERI